MEPSEQNAWCRVLDGFGSWVIVFLGRNDVLSGSDDKCARQSAAWIEWISRQKQAYVTDLTNHPQKNGDVLRKCLDIAAAARYTLRRFVSKKMQTDSPKVLQPYRWSSSATMVGIARILQECSRWLWGCQFRNPDLTDWAQWEASRSQSVVDMLCEIAAASYAPCSSMHKGILLQIAAELERLVRGIGACSVVARNVDLIPLRDLKPVPPPITTYLPWKSHVTLLHVPAIYVAVCLDMKVSMEELNLLQFCDATSKVDAATCNVHDEEALRDVEAVSSCDTERITEEQDSSGPGPFQDAFFVPAIQVTVGDATLWRATEQLHHPCSTEARAAAPPVFGTHAADKRQAKGQPEGRKPPHKAARHAVT